MGEFITFTYADYHPIGVIKTMQVSIVAAKSVKIWENPFDSWVERHQALGRPWTYTRHQGGLDQNYPNKLAKQARIDDSIPAASNPIPAIKAC